eukprot:jgi/Ulvmu1/738/UM010_0111.1
MGDGQDCDVLLMKYPEAWGLPSLSPGCIQVEAYLRLSGISFAIDKLNTTGPSPTGCLPAVESSEGIGGHNKDRYDDLACASAAISFLCKKKDLDKELPASMAAESVAFCCLIDSRLSPAVRYSTWCEWNSVFQLPEIVGDTLPWPLNYVIPYTQAVTVTRQFRGRDVGQLYQEARCVIKALNHRAQASDGDYLLGKQPSALDAKAFGILSFIVAAPTAAPVLKDELSHSPALLAFLERVATGPFSSNAPTLQETEDRGAWSSAATGAAASAQEAAAPSPEEKKAWSKSRWWLGGVGALVVGYALLGGNYIDMVYDDDGDEDLGEELEYS